jgi:hypothetical protein
MSRSADLTPMNEALRAVIVAEMAARARRAPFFWASAKTGPEHCSVEQLLRRFVKAEGDQTRRATNGVVTATGSLFAGQYATPHRIAELRHYEEHPIDPDDAPEADLVRQLTGIPCPHRNVVPSGDGERCDDCCAAYRTASSEPWQVHVLT